MKSFEDWFKELTSDTRKEKEMKLEVIQFWILRFQYFIGGMATTYIVIYFIDAINHYSDVQNMYTQSQVDLFVIMTFIGGLMIGLLIALMNRK